MIRPLALADLDDVLRLDAATNPHPWNCSQWEDSLAQHQCLGLEANGRLEGFAVAMPLPDEAELLLIAIHPDLQGKGLGQRLLAALNTALKLDGKARLLLEVRASNLQAQRFYVASGFVEIGRRKNYYPCENGREDALLYALNLDGYRR